ncbi:unnamed protein product [Brassica rapa subsp. trilocularis]
MISQARLWLRFGVSLRLRSSPSSFHRLRFRLLTVTSKVSL